MAIMIPNRITADRRATPGERKTFEILAKRLDKSWYVWYDVGIGNKEIYPDFILIHPHYGLLVLEVKDFHFSDLQSISNDRFVTSSRTQLNPLRQARNYIFEIINDRKLEKSPPYQYGVVFPNITRNELQLPVNGVSIAEIIPTSRILNKHDLRESRFSAVLIDMVKENRSEKRMSLSMFNELRYRIDPSLSIPSTLISKEIQSNTAPIVLDHIQERIAKGIGEGHRLLRGIAGSGKTLIMLYRAKLLCRLNPEWNILFICWNRSLINYLEQVFKSIKMEVSSQNVQFVYFSSWIKEISKTQNIELPQMGNDKESQVKYEREYTLAIKRLLDSSPTKNYQAIMIDEGQDFKDDYYRLLLHHLDSKTNSLLICYDLAQNLYDRTTSWKELGISIYGGRTLTLGTVNDQLVRNYRNSWEITRFSKLLYNDRIPDKDGEDNYIHIETISGRLTHGPPPFLHLLFDRKEEYEKIVSWVTQLIVEKKLDFSDFLIIYPGKKIRDFDVEFGLLPVLSEAGIPFNWISENQFSKSQFSFSENTIKISTVGSAKGMDFEACVVVGCDCIRKDSPEVLLYVAATRARKYLLFTSGGRNHKVKKILESSYENLMALKKLE